MSSSSFTSLLFSSCRPISYCFWHTDYQKNFRFFWTYYQFFLSIHFSSPPCALCLIEERKCLFVQRKKTQQIIILALHHDNLFTVPLLSKKKTKLISALLNSLSLSTKWLSQLWNIPSPLYTYWAATRLFCVMPLYIFNYFLFFFIFHPVIH